MNHNGNRYCNCNPLGSLFQPTGVAGWRAGADLTSITRFLIMPPRRSRKRNHPHCSHCAGQADEACTFGSCEGCCVRLPSVDGSVCENIAHAAGYRWYRTAQDAPAVPQPAVPQPPVDARVAALSGSQRSAPANAAEPAPSPPQRPQAPSVPALPAGPRPAASAAAAAPRDVLDVEERGPEPAVGRRQDPLSRTGPLACHVISTADLYERALRVWQYAVRWRAEDVVEVDTAFARLTNEVFSPASDILADPRYIVASGAGIERTYSYTTDPEAMPLPAATVLAMALQSAASWGERMVGIMKAEAATGDASAATLLLNQQVRVGARSAALAELRTLQVAAVGPVAGLPDAGRLADGNDFLAIGLHVATVRPDRLRTFLTAVALDIARRYIHRNRDVLVTLPQWEAIYGQRSRAPPLTAPSTRGQRRWRAGAGGERASTGPSARAPPREERAHGPQVNQRPSPMAGPSWQGQRRV